MRKTLKLVCFAAMMIAVAVIAGVYIGGRGSELVKKQGASSESGHEDGGSRGRKAANGDSPSTMVARLDTVAEPASSPELEAMQRELAGIPSQEVYKQAEDRSIVQGYFSDEDLAAYDGYAEDALIALGDNGDLRALRVLANRYMNSGEVDKWSAALDKAVVYGSTAALMEIGSYKVGMADYISDTKEKQAQLIEGLAWYEVGIKRGDDYYRLLKEQTIERYGISVKPAGGGLIEARAFEILSELEKKRIALGLPQFDNSQPREMIEYHQRVKEMDDNLKRNKQANGRD